jgi:hypothetical protein
VPLLMMTHLTRRPVVVIEMVRRRVPCRIQKFEFILFSQTLRLVNYHWMIGFHNLNQQVDFVGLSAVEDDDPLDWKAFGCHRDGKSTLQN